MNTDSADDNDQNAWESAHICPNCGYDTNLAELDLMAVTTGIVTCPRCDWSGQIEIEIVKSNR